MDCFARTKSVARNDGVFQIRNENELKVFRNDVFFLMNPPCHAEFISASFFRFLKKI